MENISLVFMQWTEQLHVTLEREIAILLYLKTLITLGGPTVTSKCYSSEIKIQTDQLKNGAPVTLNMMVVILM